MKWLSIGSQSVLDVLEQLVFRLVTLTAFKFYLGRRKECSIKHYNIQNDYEPPSIFFPLSEIDKIPVVKNLLLQILRIEISEYHILIDIVLTKTVRTGF